MSMGEWFDNVVDKDFLQENLTFTSIFIALYEHFTDYVVFNVKDFLCDIEIKDGKLICKKTEEYNSEILNRIVDEKGNKDVIKASFLWLADNGAITDNDYKKFLALKGVRNKYAHEMAKIIYNGVDEEEITLLFDMYSLYSDISKWFFTEIEAPIIGYEITKEVDLDKIQSIASYAFGIVLNALYGGKSEEYKKMIASIKSEVS